MRTRGQERLFGTRSSETTTHRVLKSIDDALLGWVRAARAGARARVWDTGARPQTITLNIDATLLTAHSEKEMAAGNDKHGYGFHPLNCYLDETGEALAAILRPGNAGSNTAADHCTVLGLALAQLPAEDRLREILVRADIGGQTHAFTADCRDAGIRFSVGYELSETVRSAILQVPEAAWVQAIDAGGKDRDGAWVAELIDRIDLSAWPEGSRRICRSERPHPGAQFQIFDEHGYRYTCFLTDQDGKNIAQLELAHRGRTRVEDSIRAGKDTGMRNPSAPRLRAQPNLAGALTDRPRPALLDQADLPDRRALDRRTQTPSPAAAAYRRQARASRATHPSQARSRLALVQRARRRVRAAPDDPGALLSTQRNRGHDLTTDSQRAHLRLPKNDRHDASTTPLHDPARQHPPQQPSHPATRTIATQ